MDADTRIKMGRVIARAWLEEDYLEQLRSNPRDTLTEAGIDVPAGCDVVLLEDTDDTIHVVLPSRPAELADAEITSELAKPSIKLIC